MKKRLLALMLSATFIIGLLSGCGKSNDETTTDAQTTDENATVSETENEAVDVGEPVEGGVVSVRLSSSPKYLDPVKYTGAYESQIIQNVCETLVDYNSSMTEIVPVLAESWTISEDGTAYTFKLREDVYFHAGEYQDGRQMTAEDVKYSLERSNAESAMNRLDMLDHCEVISDFEVVCHLAEPSAVFLTVLTDAGNVIIPKEEVEGWGDSFGDHLIGTGPFILEKFELDQQSTLTANKEYWGNTPYLDGAVFKVIADNNQAANALRTGEVNIAPRLAGESVEVVRNDKSVRLEEMASLSMSYLFFNMVSGPTADPLVRQAIIMAVDVEELTNGVFKYGEAIPSTVPLPMESWGYDKSVEALIPAYDPEAAKALLAEAGYEDGFEMDLYIANTTARVDMATLFQAYMEMNLGIKVNVNTSEWGTFSEIGASGEADIFGMTWSWYPDPYFFLNKLFHSESIGSLGNGQGFSNAKVDELLDSALIITDQDERAAIYSEALTEIVKEYPGIFYANENIEWGLTSNVQGTVLRADDKVILCSSDVNVWLSK